MVDVQDSVALAAHPHPRATPAGATVLRFRDDAAFDGPVVAFADFGGDSNAAAVRVDPADDARALVPHLARLRLIEVSFPKYRDGRGYSAARVLREAGYTGELRAAGDVLVDQLHFMRRVGFDSFAPAKPLDPAAVDAALTRFPFVYQKAADSAVPVWALRHG
jgi:uncharacterized protein (DUF934 family)